MLCALALGVAGCEPAVDEPAVEPAVEEPPVDDVEEPPDEDEPEPEEDPELRRVEGVTTALDYAEFEDEGIGRWEEEVPRVEDVRIPSTVDDHEQPAMWLPPAGAGEASLLVVLHSWHTEYQQHQSIPYALWADEQGWAAIFPNFRGVFDRPEATGSDLAVQDVIDAIDFAGEQASVDLDRVYVAGFSGGGMMSLLVAGRHPDRVGSPSQHLDAIRDAGLPVYLAHGLQDEIVRPDATLEAFNQLADAEGEVAAEGLEAAVDNELPEQLLGSVETETYFEDEDPDVVFARESAGATVVLFEGEHDKAYHPALSWVWRLAEESG